MSETAHIPQLRFPEFSGEWEEKNIEDVFEFKNGINKEKEYFGKGYPIINFTDVYHQYGMTGSSINGLVETTEIEQDRYSAKKGDVFFTRTSETIDDIGMSAVLLEDIDKCVFSGFVLRARPKKDVLVNTFSKYCFSIYPIRKEIVTKSSFTTRALTSGTLLNKVIFSYPSKPEQQKIAEFLSSVDNKIEQLSKKKELLGEYKKGLMQKIFSQEIRFKADDGSAFPDWEEKKLGDVARFFSGGTPTSTNRSYYSGDIPFIGSGRINDSTVEQFITQEALENSSAKMVDKGDLLYALYGATSGEVGISKLNGAINQAVLCVRSQENVYFLYQWLQYKKERILSTYLQGGQGNLSAQIVKSLKLNIPSKPEQTKIASFLSSINIKIEQVGKQLNESKQFKNALLQQMFV